MSWFSSSQTDLRYQRKRWIYWFCRPKFSWLIHPKTILKPLAVMVKPCYPLVNIQKAIESCHRNSWITHKKWWCSIVMLVYRRVNPIFDEPPMKPLCLSRDSGLRLPPRNSAGPTLKLPAQIRWDMCQDWTMVNDGKCIYCIYIYIHVYNVCIYMYIYIHDIPPPVIKHGLPENPPFSSMTFQANETSI